LTGPQGLARQGWLDPSNDGGRPIARTGHRTTGNRKGATAVNDQDNGSQVEVRMPDPEIEALKFIVHALKELDLQTQTRVADYLYDRFGGA
jgi:hypothetical protein